MRRTFAVTVAVLCAAAVAAPASATAVPSAGVGISDQTPSAFNHPVFGQAGFRYARYITPWNSIFADPVRLDEWIQAAKLRGLRLLISFNHTAGDRCPSSPCALPSVRAYTRAWEAFHSKYPEIKDISPWNEANHQSQPTGRRPKRAAEFYNVVRANCAGCRIVAADLLDGANMENYFTEFSKTAIRPRIWGLHNYTDTNRFRSTGTRTLLRLVPRRGGHQIWFTETGGVVSFVTTAGRVALAYDEGRAERSIHHMFRLAEIDRRRIKRMYIYHWAAAAAGVNRFDAGLVRSDGSVRPSFNALLQEQGRPTIPGVVVQPPPAGAPTK